MARFMMLLGAILMLAPHAALAQELGGVFKPLPIEPIYDSDMDSDGDIANPYRRNTYIVGRIGECSFAPESTCEYSLQPTAASAAIGCGNGAWTADPEDVAAPLDAAPECEYRFYQRDASSGAVGAPSESFSIQGDVQAPEPNPAEFLVLPFAAGTDTIIMWAKGATEPHEKVSAPIRYRFVCTTAALGCNNSGWIPREQFMNTAIFVDDGLSPDTTYCYTVQYRDGSLNTSEPSAVACAATPNGPNAQPPLPNPVFFTDPPRSTGAEDEASMTVSPAFSSSAVEYRFVCESATNGCTTSAWQSSTTYLDTGLTPGVQQCYRAQARDSAEPPNVGALSQDGTGPNGSVCFTPFALTSNFPTRFDASKCDDDGVTEVPWFAMGRDADDCLLIDQGNGGSPVRIQWDEHYHGRDLIPRDCSVPGKTKWQIKPSNGGCPNGNCATMLGWDTEISGYHAPCEGQGSEFQIKWGLQYTFLKHISLGNTWKCHGFAWTGQHSGMTCPEAEKNTTHVDGIQHRTIPTNAGWTVIQDTLWHNGYNEHGLFQSNPEGTPGPTGSVVFQGIETGRKAPFLNAVDWESECGARSGNTETGGICNVGLIKMDAEYPAVWSIDVWAPDDSVEIDPKGPDLAEGRIGVTKFIMVSRGCSEAGCTGDPLDRSYTWNSWPHPLKRGAATNPAGAVCPNGLLDVGPPSIYCYDDLETALADSFTATSNVGDCPDCPHIRPPFIQLSCAGWTDPETNAPLAFAQGCLPPGAVQP